MNNAQSDIYAGKVLAAMAGRVSSELAAFSSWMVAAFGAVFALLVANVDTVGKFIAPTAIGLSIKIFLGAVVLNVVQRYLATVVMASVAIGKEVESLPVDCNIDIQHVFRQMEKATFWPTRLLARWVVQRVSAGDFSVGGRINSRMAQIQAWLVLAQLLSVVAAALVIANALYG